jgi:uncharacterized cupin superfamily protein
MTIVNVATSGLTVTQEQGRFRFRGEELGERLGGRIIGAAIYEMGAGETNWPYHCHHGVEEWMYIVSGSPVLRDPSGERSLTPGTLVAFAAGPAGAHTVAGPGRVVIFSAGAAGWSGAWASVYPDSDKVGVAGMMFRRADAIDAWTEPAPAAPRAALSARAAPGPEGACPSVDLTSIGAGELAPVLGSRSWAPTLWELSPGESSGPYGYQRLREEWALVVSGTPALRHPDGEEALATGDLVGFPEGPDGAHRLSGAGAEPARVLVISTPPGRPSATVHPDEGTAVLRLSDHEGFRFRLSDRIEDYWDGEPGAQRAWRLA